MQRPALFIASLFVLNIFIQTLINVYFFSDQPYFEPLKSVTNISGSCIKDVNEVDLLNILTEINKKLDLHDHESLGAVPVASLKKNAVSQFDEKALTEMKDSLMNDMSRSDMTLPAFLTDSRLKSLPEADQQVILTELTRRIDSGEIDKKTFLPGFKK